MTDTDNPPSETWLTRPQLTERWCLPPNTLAEWAKKRRGPRYATFGKYVRYRLSDVIAYEEAQLGSGDGAA